MAEFYTEEDFMNYVPFADINIQDMDEYERTPAEMRLELMAKRVGLTPTQFKALYRAYMSRFSKAKKSTKVTASEDDDLARFHEFKRIDGRLKPIGVRDQVIVDDIVENNDLFILEGKLYLYRHGVYVMDRDDVLFPEIVRKYMYKEVVKDARINGVVNLLKTVPEIVITEAELNHHPAHWINCRNGMLDVKTLELHPHDPSYMSINQIPHEWRNEAPGSDSITSLFIESLIPDEDDREMLLQYIGYALTTDTSQQKFMIIRGDGGTGKSVLLRMVQNLVGKENCSNMTMQNLNDRFSPSFLLGKLMNVYADLPSASMDEANGIKTITGDDMVRAEYKGGKVFFFKPYCKLLFSANRIPMSKDDQTTAYYRRILILPIPERAAEFENLERRLKKDTQSLFYMAVHAASRMYESGRILESENSIQEVSELYKFTDSIRAFIEDRMELKKESKIERKRLYDDYLDYCEDEERMAKSRNSFYQSMREKGFPIITVQGRRYFKGLDYKPFVEEESDITFENEEVNDNQLKMDIS